jgi:hypothetical protein
MRARAAGGVLWLGTVGLLVLAARSVAYALASPSPLSSRLRESAGGPRLVLVTLCSLGLAGILSIAAVWLVAVGVRERQRLHPERELPRLRLARLAARAVALFAASSFAFAMFESYLHRRAGLGFHGLCCLAGPVHRNAIPLLAALALVAAALAEAASHLAAWARATVRALRSSRVTAEPESLPAPHLRLPLVSTRLALRSRPRAPPQPA